MGISIKAICSVSNYSEEIFINKWEPVRKIIQSIYKIDPTPVVAGSRKYWKSSTDYNQFLEFEFIKPVTYSESDWRHIVRTAIQYFIDMNSKETITLMFLDIEVNMVHEGIK